MHKTMWTLMLFTHLAQSCAGEQEIHPLYQILQAPLHSARTRSTETSLQSESHLPIAHITPDALTTTSTSSSSTSPSPSSDHAQRPKRPRGATRIETAVESTLQLMSTQRTEFAQTLQKQREELDALIQKHDAEQRKAHEQLKAGLEDVTQMERNEQIGSVTKTFLLQLSHQLSHNVKEFLDKLRESDGDDVSEVDEQSVLLETDSGNQNQSTAESLRSPSGAATAIQPWVAVQSELSKHRSQEDKLTVISKHLEALKNKTKGKNYYRSLLEKACILLKLYKEGKADLCASSACFKLLDKKFFETRTLPIYNACGQEIKAFEDRDYDLKRHRRS